ncbi:MAG: cytochrome c oxidase accessory protein CcoG [Bacteroidota bacterium]|nr:cytochrome c oxidase accessory protein CcoG [Bacteroidota bacterium]MDP4232426.1 cytochrome c oxidase accessory protein CcoG [Bacteroidota bacterium]MDP4241562.1 cytochrome c oxidase accessory protein CcoG [Bacteroidota bacterium]MDP4286306.1 cytochrome c oxidase accessory protein CcoG [Bacteroidota bacterium]
MALTDLDLIQEEERFRSQLASVASDGRRKWIYARKPKGSFTRWRTAVAGILLAFLAVAPFIKIGGDQFLLFDLINRKFVLLGFVIWPEDFYLIVVLFLAGLVSIVVFTSVLGRIWCGWLCPQTVFMEMVFRRIEWLIDGTAGEQLTRHRGPWTASRVARLVLKQSIFFAISFAIANVFLAYVVSSDALQGYVKDGPLAHLELFIALLAFTVVFYLVFARFREQACLVVCPYGRFMSALVDDNTVTVTYDAKRGEPRSKWKRDDTRTERDTGHCIDCHQCVAVCPTGIDIRNGIQLECVACTACIDACDDVMTKVNLPKGLIRYASATAVQTGNKKWLTPRVKAYGALWTVLTLLTIGLFVFRSDLDVRVLRSPGTTWTMTQHGTANFYDVQIINKGSRDLAYTLTAIEPKNATITPLGLPLSVKRGERVQGRFLVEVPSNPEHADDEHEHEHGAHEVHLVLALHSGNEIVKQVKSELLIP